MFRRVLPAVLAILLGGISVQAGLIKAGLPGSGISGDSKTDATVLADWFPSHASGYGYVAYLQAADSDLAGAVSSSPSFFAPSAVSCRFSLPLPPVGLAWRIFFGNSSLPESPIQDGILKPS